MLSGSHLELAAQIMDGLKAEGADKSIKVVIGGIIPVTDFPKLEALGIVKVFTLSDYDLLDIMESVVGLLEEQS